MNPVRGLQARRQDGPRGAGQGARWPTSWANLLGPSIVHPSGLAKATDPENEAYFKKKT